MDGWTDGPRQADDAVRCDSHNVVEYLKPQQQRIHTGLSSGAGADNTSVWDWEAASAHHRPVVAHLRTHPDQVDKVSGNIADQLSVPELAAWHVSKDAAGAELRTVTRPRFVLS